jgi:hypothetical protein
MSDALRRELMLFGIEVVIIESGTVNTAMYDKGEKEDQSEFKLGTHILRTPLSRGRHFTRHSQGDPISPDASRHGRDGSRGLPKRSRLTMVRPPRLTKWPGPALLSGEARGGSAVYL